MSAELDALFDQTKSLAATPRTITELPGGLTNRNYKVTTPDGTFVARICGWLGLPFTLTMRGVGSPQNLSDHPKPANDHRRSRRGHEGMRLLDYSRRLANSEPVPRIPAEFPGKRQAFPDFPIFC